MDSIGARELTESTLLQIATIYKTAEQALQIKYKSVQVQNGCHDCGLFSIANAIEACEGNDAAKLKFNQGKMRKHLADCFVKKKLLPFPKAKKDLLPRPKAKSETFELFCKCHMPEIYDHLMINCDSCQRWYHYTCVGIAEGNVPSLWECHMCI